MRGDAYMNAVQAVLTVVPWFPIIGNHESSDGDHYQHYQAIAWGEGYGINPDTPFPRNKNEMRPVLRSTATSALGAHLSCGTFYGMGLHGSTVPSNTSRYASTNLGLIHMVGLDLNNLDPDQLAWLEADLVHVNKKRESTPWIMVMSHSEQRLTPITNLRVVPTKFPLCSPVVPYPGFFPNAHANFPISSHLQFKDDAVPRNVSRTLPWQRDIGKLRSRRG